MSCCHPDDDPPVHEKPLGLKQIFRGDPILYGSLAVIVPALAFFFIMGADHGSVAWLAIFGRSIIDLLGEMWWGVALGMAIVGLMSKVPREYFTYVLGRGDTLGGLVRAALAGVLLDMCSHGILMISARLYERGASIAQVMTFLIASPWNSFSLTLVLIALIGMKWTLLYIAASALVAVVTGLVFKQLTLAGKLPPNPHSTDLPEGFRLFPDAKMRFRQATFNKPWFSSLARSSWTDGKMILRWLLLGTLLDAAIRAFVPMDMFSTYFGPSLIGLGMTLVAATVIEVCSEGSAPIAADLLTRAAAPGNGFAFLMAGVATDYTEMMVIRDFTKSWKAALFLPLITVPQVMLIGWLMNNM